MSTQTVTIEQSPVWKVSARSISVPVSVVPHISGVSVLEDIDTIDCSIRVFYVNTYTN